MLRHLRGDDGLGYHLWVALGYLLLGDIALVEKVLGFITLLGQVLLVSKKLVEVDHVLIEKHASDSSGQGVAECLLDYGIDGISNELLSLIRGGD